MNNRKTARRKLEAGDVIRMEGTTLVFDEDMTRMSASSASSAPSAESAGKGTSGTNKTDGDTSARKKHQDG
ncbi:hypothetical protein L21SP2_3036 [Salinispira pacifica]|uniref:Uncharacterized protein n=1 Tax=Salinispira pacifica TaxID=1307761 RepID=V5WL49_9SPIO|nr:hypothetical protein L21SP2_3036 [Salinispira pacifica]